MDELYIAKKISTLGGRLYIVGGWIRNILADLPPKDKDYLVVGIDEGIWEENFPTSKKIGKAFPVYLMEVAGKKCEFALARKEKKVAPGYKGFTMEFNKDITLQEDLYRRDTRANGIAYDVLTKEIVDPYCGQDDINKKKLTPMSEHFIEDPLRTLRLARQSCELDFTIDAKGYNYMALTKDELAYEPGERIFNEMSKALASKKPGDFFRHLERGEVLPIIFPEIDDLIGQTQPVMYHPEGDAYEHTLKVLDDVAEKTDSLLARFCALVHDLGKGRTPKEELPHHYGHEHVGTDVLLAWNKRMTLPKKWIKGGEFVIETHMKAGRLTRLGKILKLILSLKKSVLTPDEYRAVIAVDNGSLPWYLLEYEKIIEALNQIDMKEMPDNLSGEEIRKWIEDKQLRVLVEYKRNRNN